MDITTLVTVITLMLVLVSMAMAMHWLANFDMKGLGAVAVGVAGSTVAMGLTEAHTSFNANSVRLLSDALFLYGGFWLWIGLAHFWHEKSRKTVYWAGGTLFLALLFLINNAFTTEIYEQRSTVFFLFLGVLSLGTVYTIAYALGGHTELYKQLIKRSRFGVGLVLLLFFGHAFFNFYYAGCLYASEGTPAPSLSQLEMAAFLILLAFAVIIMTTERLQNALKIQAMMDALTGALNRGAFTTVAKAVIARARRNSEPVSMLLMDIDKLKKLNERYGHAFGDDILKKVSVLMMDGRRAQDVFGRFGGEEFTLLLPGTPEEGMALVANRIEKALEEGGFTHVKGDVQISISKGYVTARGDDLDLDGMLDSAYKALYIDQHRKQIRFKVQA